MASNVQCPVCTLFLLPGMDLSDHLETHPKEQVIKALVQLSLKSEVSETESPDNPKKANKCDERTTTPMSEEASECESNSASETLGIHEKRSDNEENAGHASLHQDLVNRQSGYLFENNNGSSSGNSNNYLGPPNPYYHYENHQQHQQQQQLPPPPMPQQQHHHLHHHNHLQQNYNPYNSHPHGGTNSSIGQQSSQPPMRLFSYQQPPKPLQPPPAYGAAISQIRSQNSQNLMVNNVNRPPYTPGTFTPTSSSSASPSSLSATPSRLPPPLPPPPLNQRHQSSFSQAGALFNEPCDNNAMSPRRSSTTPPMRPPPQLYRSPMSSNGQYSRQSNSPYAVMTGSPSVLRFAESPVTAQYLERENGDFIVQETPKHVVECVEKDDGEFSVIERVYHMPPSVVQINEDHDDNLSDQGSNCDDMKMSADEDGSNSAWTVEGSSEQSEATEQREQKKSGITVLSDVQLDINEYLDLMGNIIASGKVAKTRTEIIKIEKFEVDDEVKEEAAGDMSFNEELEDDVLFENGQKFDGNLEECEPNNDSSPICIPVTAPSMPVTPGTTSVIRLAATTSARSNTPSFAPKVEETAQSQGTEGFESKADITDDQQKIEEQEQTTSNTKIADETEGTTPSTSAFTMKNEEGNTDTNTSTTTTASVSKVEETIPESSLSGSQNQTDQGNPMEPENEEKQIKKEINQQISTYQQSIKRPIKKVPKKLIIKPKSKPARAPTPTQVPTPVASTSTEIVSLDNQKEEVISEAEEDLKSVKSEKIAFTVAESVPPPLFAAADEKLPPDDDVMPSTSSGRDGDTPLEQQSEEDKPPAVLAAFLDQCMKKEEEPEDHPMHSIFGMDIDSTAHAIDDGLTPQPTSEFPSASLFAKPLTTSEHLALSESALPDSSELQQHQDQNQPQQQSTTSYVEYPFSFLYSTEANQQEEHKHDISPPMYCNEDFNKYSASTSGGNSASCTWYQSQSSENDFEIDGKGSYLDLDSCKRSTSFAAATEGSLPTTEDDALNIRTDEKMPAKGEISGQESNCGLENSWSQPLYSEFPARFPNPYQNFMSTHESWSHDHYFRPQDLSSSVETKNFGLRLTEESPVTDALPSTSKRKAKPATKLIRKKSFQCAHCNTHFPLLKEKNAHLIKQHGYKRVNRRLIRDPPTSTVTTATMNAIDAGASLLLGLDACALLPPPALPEEEDSKAAIVKIEQENQEQKDSKKSLASLALSLAAAATTTSTTLSRTKYDSMRARDNRMLINFNLNALSVKNECDAQQYYAESKSSFFCFVCRRDFVTVKLFDEHLAEHPAECFTCHKKFTRWKNFMVHLKRHLGWKDFACTYCEKKFVIRSALVEHMRMHTGHTPLKCKICGKSFKRYSNLTQHRKRHGTKINRNKEYVCYCGEVLPSKARFIWHKETHDLKPKCCPYCRDRFVHANSLRRHIRLAHSDKFDYTEPMECPMCKQIYAKSSIKAHMATHSMDTQHECLICNKSFSTKWNLKIHNWVHANRTTKPFKCDQCVKAFVREVDYNNHMNSHKQIKPYTCEHCGCKFIRKYNYIRHRREHHGNKKFTCDLCGKLFHRHYYLIEHRRIHTGERPFQCTICGKSSTTKTNHNKHLKIHHSRDPFTSEA